MPCGTEPCRHWEMRIPQFSLTGWRAALRRRWHDQSVRRQLMISISTISIGAILLSILLAVLDARGRVEVEVNSSMELAQQLVRDMVKRMTTEAQMQELFNAVPAQLKYVRHARILATNREGELVQIAPDEAAKRQLEGRSDQAPHWFTDLVGPTSGLARSARGPRIEHARHHRH